MPPLRVNRRRFLGCSAAAGWALAQGRVDEAAPPGTGPVRLGLIGLGNRGTALLRAALEIPAAQVVAVCDPVEKHCLRAQGIAEKAGGGRPAASSHPEPVLRRTDLDAVLVAVPCDLHAPLYEEAIRQQKHLYAEKPLALSVAECDRLLRASAAEPGVVVHVGHQRRSNPRYQEGVALLRRGELGPLLSARAAWISSNGPVGGHDGWLARRARSGDWMVEQAVHVWDVLNWVAGGPPARAFGTGRRGVFGHLEPDRDVTDHYEALLEWPGGFQASFVQSWIDPPDNAFTGNSLRVVGTAGGFDFGTGVATFRDRSRSRLTVHPGNLPETRLALQAFFDAVRSPTPPPPPLSLEDARSATLTGLLVRRAIDERRVVAWEEIATEA